MSLSYHWLSTPDAPAPSAIAKIPIDAKKGFKSYPLTGVDM